MTPIDDAPARYEIRLEGWLDTDWSSRFQGARVVHTHDGVTHVTCLVRDQSELFGLLKRVRDLGLPLIAIARISDSGAHDDHDDRRAYTPGTMRRTMKAITQYRYGSPDVLNYEDIPKPVPTDENVLVKIHAASVNAADWHLMRADPALVRLMGGGFFKPKDRVVGLDAAGVVESVGAAVTRFKPGDPVFGNVNGAFAEYACTNHKNLALKPANVTFQQAAAVPTAGVTALQGLRDHGGLKSGHHVLVNGGASGVGVYAIQIAKAFGARVTAVCGPGKLDVARLCGADRVVDYAQTDVLREDARYDVILDNAAYRSVKDYARIMTPQGAYVLVGGTLGNLLKGMLGGRSKGAGQRFTGFYASINSDDLQALADLMASGAVRSPIDRCFPLEQTADAIRYMEARKVKGKIVITMPEHA